MNDKTEEVIEFLTTGIVACLFVWMVVTAFSTPIVVKSNASGECVEVIPEGSCDDLPTKYSTEWSE